MNAYIYQADLYCTDCNIKIKIKLPFPKGGIPLDESSYDSDNYPKGPFPNGGGKADSPQHCGSCGEFLENPLTEDGERYVIKAIANAQICPAQGEIALLTWKPFYSYLYEGDNIK